MPWPGITDFSEAIQNPELCFEGTDLETGTVSLNQRGTPFMFSGNFACVYPVSVGNQAYAVRCFTREVSDQQSRYGELNNYLLERLPLSFVGFEYLEHGIRIKGEWYPIVKMEWVKGEPLSKFVESRLDQPHTLRRSSGAVARGLGSESARASHRPQRPAARQRYGAGGRQHPPGRLRQHVPAAVQRESEARSWDTRTTSTRRGRLSTTTRTWTTSRPWSSTSACWQSPQTPACGSSTTRTT